MPYQLYTIHVDGTDLKQLTSVEHGLRDRSLVDGETQVL